MNQRPVGQVLGSDVERAYWSRGRKTFLQRFCKWLTSFKKPLLLTSDLSSVVAGFQKFDEQ